MWNFDPSQYEEKEGFSIIPAGDHRVRIEDVISKKSKNGRDMFEITLAVSGHSSRLWYYLVLDPADPKKTNQRIGDFFNSFGITDFNMANYPRWKGKVGAVRVAHEEYNGENQAKVRFCLNRKNQDKLPPAKFASAVAENAAPTNNYAPITMADDELPFN
jgi:hypothetical protein